MFVYQELDVKKGIINSKVHNQQFYPFNRVSIFIR